MAQYKVPQDVEADDKLIGPFSFRQFIYLLIVAALSGLAFGLFKIFPLLAIAPVPFILFFCVLALPLKKDQPMETYLAAVVSFYLKPRTRIWTPGQRESTIKITAPKIVEVSRTRSISGEEATHRLSFLADIVDTGGYAIRGTNSPMQDEFAAEANSAPDMFETHHFDNLTRVIKRDEDARHDEVVKSMRDAIAKNNDFSPLFATAPTIVHRSDNLSKPAPSSPSSPSRPEASIMSSPVVVVPGSPIKDSPAPSVPTNPPAPPAQAPDNSLQNPIKPSIIELANNASFSVDTIAKEANRIKRKENGEVFISLH